MNAYAGILLILTDACSWGLIGTVARFVLDSGLHAVQASGAALASVLLYTAPAWVALFPRFFFGELLTAAKLAAIAGLDGHNRSMRHLQTGIQSTRQTAP